MKLKQVRSIFADILTLGDPVDWSTIRYQQTTGWDSLAHMALVGELEDAFEIMLDTDDVIAMSSFDEALKILARYGVDTAA